MTLKSTLPNILITGTPGTGKTTVSAQLLKQLPSSYKHINVSEFVKQKKCYESYDEAFDSYILDEDKLIDLLEPDMAKRTGFLIDFHTCDIFDPELIDIVVVLKSATEVLYDRLMARGYGRSKLDENIGCEIMQVVHECAVDAYGSGKVLVLTNENENDLEENIEAIIEILQSKFKLKK